MTSFAEESPVVIAAFYRFAPLAELDALRRELIAQCRSLALSGTLLLAPEGLNATVAGDAGAVDALLDRLQALPGCGALSVRRSRAATNPFRRMKVRIKREIVSFGVDGIRPHRRTGQRVSPAEFNALLQDPRVLVLDTRNDYEYRIGTFAGARNPHTDHFRGFAAFVDTELAGEHQTPVAMFCTGGIRCEKASAYLLERGFENVYQLDGGILRYLEEVPSEASLWRGDCFVFDGRVAVDEHLQPAGYEQCPGCRRPLSAADRASPHYEPGIACAACHTRLSDAQRRAFAERHRQQRLAAARGDAHLGAIMAGDD